MPNPLSARIPGNLVVRSGLVVATFIAVPLLVTAAQSLQCVSPGHWGRACPQSEIILPAMPEAKPAGPATSPAGDAMLAATFETLLAPATPKPAPIDDRQLVAAASEPVQPLQPVARKVKTTAIRALTAPQSEDADVAPMALAEISAPAEDEALGAIAEVTAAAPAEAEPEPAIVEETVPDEPEPSAEPSNTRIVAGQGVNVRSGPGKSQSKLFALAGGTKVTIGENRKGWLKVTDGKGRTGWVYKDYLLAS